jgi:hypothetical protein
MTTHEEKAREIVANMAEGCPYQFGTCPYDICTCRMTIATALRDCERQTLERAAKVAQEIADDDGMDAYRIPFAIRALGTKDTTNGE